MAPPLSVGAWSTGELENIDLITRRAGYGGVFTLTGLKHLRVTTAVRNRGKDSRKRRAWRLRLAGYGTL